MSLASTGWNHHLLDGRVSAGMAMRSCLVLVCCVFLGACKDTAQAAESATAMLSAANRPVQWTGAPVADPAIPATSCMDEADPRCDHFALHIDAPAGEEITLHIFTNAPDDDYDVAVFYPDGHMAAEGKKREPGGEQIRFPHRPEAGSGPYRVHVVPHRTTPASWYQAVVDFASSSGVEASMPFDLVRGCGGVVTPPGAIGVNGVTDDGRTIRLRVLALLDGVGDARARAEMQKAARAYAELGIQVRTSYRRVYLRGTEAGLLIDQARHSVGGAVPPEFHIVHILTAKDIRSDSTNVAGLADCVGGIAYPSRAFSIGEVFTTDGSSILGVPLRSNWSAKIVAHEIGHLLGGAHERANCLEGLPADTTGDLASACTLMFNSLDAASLRFSLVNGLVVRGHGTRFAR